MYYRSNTIGAGILAFIAGAVIWSVFGKKIKSAVSKDPNFAKLKKQIYKQASEVSDLTREKYDEIVESASRNYAKLQGISENELRDLIEDLRMHWWRIKNAWNEN